MSDKKKKDPRFWVGFDLGGTKMMAAVFDDKLRIVARKRRKTKAQEGMAAGLEKVVATIKEAIDKAGVAPEHLAGIGMGSPGPLDLDNGILLDTPNLGWRNVPMREYLEKAFGCPAVIANDVDAGVYGEYRLGAGKGARCVLGVFPGTGIGGGCVYEGKILRGKSSSVLEFGHMQVLPDGPICGCGRRGCLEAVASRLAISAAAAAAAYRGDAPYLLANAGTDLSNVRSGIIAASIEAGDAAVERIVRDAAHWLGIGVANVVNLLGPDVVVLGGGLAEALPDLLSKEIGKTARNRVMPAFKDTFSLVVAKLGDDATASGAAAWAEEVVMSATG